ASRPRLLVIGGPTGSGKSWLMAKIASLDPSLHIVVTSTTRQPRAGEKHGVHYFFETPQTLGAAMARGELAAYTKRGENEYAVDLSRLSMEGTNVTILDGPGIDEIAAAPGIDSRFIGLGDTSLAAQRLRDRAADTAESESIIEERLANLDADAALIETAVRQAGGVDALGAILAGTIDCFGVCRDAVVDGVQ
ncbi:hypothetical protein KIPB_008450, partial [Kipferlia bialata]